MAKELDKVTLADGTHGDIVDVLEPGVAYEFLHDPPYSDDGYDGVVVYDEEIASIDEPASII